MFTMKPLPFRCFLCSKSFSAPDSLICHIKVLHSSLELSEFPCTFEGCIRKFDYIYRYSKHLKTHKCNADSSKPVKTVKPCNDSVDFNNGSESFSVIDDDNEESSSMINPEATPSENSDQILNFFNAVNNAVITAVANLYSKDAVTRSHVQEVIQEMKELFCGSFFDLLEGNVMNALQSAGSNENGSIRCMFDVMRGMFDDMDTEWKRFNVFRKQEAYIDPKTYPVGTANQEKNVRGQIVLEPVVLTGSFISPRKVLKCFLELPGVLDQILSYMNDLEKESDIMENVVQGTLWRDDIKPKFGDKLVMPLNMSFDDFETNKDLGSHAVVHKLGACHFSLACLPPKFQSVLENIFLVLLFHSSDKGFGLEEVFGPVLKELKYLEDKGIEVAINNEVKQIYFGLCLITGDNLGLNTILGFVECFTANYFCRICKVHREVAYDDITERENLIRTQVAHERYERMNDPTFTGVKTKCIWDDLKSFKVTNNLYCDIMHDLLEGMADYDMCFIISYMCEKGWVGWEELNDLVQGFYYGNQEFGNKPPLICKERIMEKETLGFSASEMLCLIRFFPLMVGHKVEKEHKVWKFYLSLRELVDLLLGPTFARSNIPYLNLQISEHHSQYKALSKKNLKPKYHMGLHFGRVISKVGPLKPIWVMRSESKYKELRQAAHVTSSRVNIPFTLAVKSSLKMCQRFLSKKGLVERLEYSSYSERVSVMSLDQFVNFSNLSSVKPDDMWNLVKWVKVNGTEYRPDMVVVDAMNDFFPQFGVINQIAITDSKEVIFVLKRLLTLGFITHLHSYQVKDYESWDCWAIVPQKNLVSHTPAHKRLFFDGNFYVMLRNAI